MVGEYAAGRVAHVNLERGDAARIGPRSERIAAPLALLQQEIDVLPGEEAEVLVHRQPQADHRDVGRGLLKALDAARNDPRAHALDLAHLDHQIRQRLRLAKQRVSLGLVAVGEIRRVHRAVVELALHHGAAAGAADARAAAVRHHEPGIEPGLQHVLALLHFVAMAARFQGDAMRHCCNPK